MRCRVCLEDCGRSGFCCRSCREFSEELDRRMEEDAEEAGLWAQRFHPNAIERREALDRMHSGNRVAGLVLDYMAVR